MPKSVKPCSCLIGVIVSLSHILFLEHIQAQSALVTLSATLESRGRVLSLSVQPVGSAEGCEVTIIGASSKRALGGSKGVTLVTLQGESGSSVTTISSLSSIKRGKGGRGRRPVSVFLKAELSCPDMQVESDVVTLRVRRKSKGIKGKKRWLNHVAKKAGAVAVTLKDTFTNLTFSKPIDLQHAGDGSDRLFVAEQGGLIKVFSRTNSSTATTFLDISSKLVSGGEQGLLGFAFHPQFSQNGFFFVNYSRKIDGATTIERYKANSASRVADLSSALTILTVEQPFGNHNAGQLAFGPDGMLYIGMGDGGSGGDPLEHGQNRKTLLGSMLRVNVDASVTGAPYSIPTDNPFVGNSSGFKEEIYAYGLRNPWRFSFDSKTKELWLADVGQNTVEEIDIIEKGKNYGWKTMEGKRCFSPTSGCDRDGLTLPIFDYPRSEGKSVTGGYVYRGTEVPDLVGSYVYADFVSGKVWALKRSVASGAVTIQSFLIRKGSFPLSELMSGVSSTYLISDRGRFFLLLPLRRYVYESS